MQLVQAVHRPGASPTKKVIAHLGPFDPLLFNNLKAALRCYRDQVDLLNAISNPSSPEMIRIAVIETRLYLPLRIISKMFRDWELDGILNGLIAPAKRTASFAQMIEALVIHRCVAPGSKLAFQNWMRKTALNEIVGASIPSMNNTRVHRAMDELVDVEPQIQSAIKERICSGGVPRILYLDLTDTWFDAGGGDLARRGQTKAGHRCKLKIHIALMVNEEGLPLRWELLPGALNETTVLPSWITYLKDHQNLRGSVLIFDRGMTSWENIWRLLEPEKGHPFLTSVKSDSISTYVDLNVDRLDALQSIGSHADAGRIEEACRALGLMWYEKETYARDLGSVPIQSKDSVIRELRAYVYFNREMQETQGGKRKEKIREVLKYARELNTELAHAKQPRKEVPTLRKICQVIEKRGLSEVLKVELVPYEVSGRTKSITSYQVRLRFDRKMYRVVKRYDGVTVLMGHPELSMTLEESIHAYRHKNTIEADFKTIKSVLKIQPTFHWTTQKIQSHVTICVLSLLIERVLEKQLEKARAQVEDLPLTAKGFLEELSGIQMMTLGVNRNRRRIRVVATERERQLMSAINAQDMLEELPEEIEYKSAP